MNAAISLHSILATTLPAAAAIAVFGTLSASSGAPPAMRWEFSSAELPPESRHPWRPDRSPTSRWSRSTILARAPS